MKLIYWALALSLCLLVQWTPTWSEINTYSDVWSLFINLRAWQGDTAYRKSFVRYKESLNTGLCNDYVCRMKALLHCSTGVCYILYPFNMQYIQLYIYVQGRQVEYNADSSLMRGFNTQTQPRRSHQEQEQTRLTRTQMSMETTTTKWQRTKETYRYK